MDGEKEQERRREIGKEKKKALSRWKEKGSACEKERCSDTKAESTQLFNLVTNGRRGREMER